MRTSVYATDNDTVHLIDQERLIVEGERARTLCGRVGTADVILGDETRGGIAATCTICRSIQRNRAV